MKLQQKSLRQLMSMNIIIQELLDVALGIKPSLLYPISQKESVIIKEIFPDLVAIDGGNKLNPVFEQNSFSNYVIAKDIKIAKNLLIAQEKEDGKEVGKLLGYPLCCIKNWVNRNHNSWSRETIYQVHKHSKHHLYFNNNIFNFHSRLGNDKNHFKALRKYNNINSRIKSLAIFKLPYLFFISHTPCSYDCKSSTLIGRRNYQLLNKYYPKMAYQMKCILNKPVLYFDIFDWIVFDGYTRNDNILYYKKIVMPISLINADLLKEFSKGNKIIVNNKDIKIFKGRILLSVYKKKDEADGFLLSFS